MNRLMAILTLQLLLVVGRSLASAGLFDGGDEVSGVSDSLLSKSTRIVGGVEVSIVSFITDMRNSLAHIICGGERRRIDPHQALIYIKSSSKHPTQAQEGRYPYVVSLTSDGSNPFCGGSLIAKDVVLTAA